MNFNTRVGVTLLETIAVVSIAGLLAGVALPAIQTTREASRRIQCSSQLRLMMQGSLEYQEANLRLPPLQTGPGPVQDTGQVSVEVQDHQHTGALAYILPFIGQQELFDLIPDVAVNPEIELPGSEFFTFFLLVADFDFRVAYNQQLEEFICPSNASYRDALVRDLFYWGPVQLIPPNGNSAVAGFQSINTTSFGRSSYLACMGGFNNPRVVPERALDLNFEQYSGAFRNRLTSLNTDQIVDGSSNVIGWSESNGWIESREDSGTGQPQLTGANFALFGNAITTGDIWNVGGPEGALFGSGEGSRPWMIGSMHPDGNSAAMCDGSVRFISRNTSRQVMTSLGCGGDSWVLPRE